MAQDQTAPIGAVLSGSTLFVSILNFVKYCKQKIAADDKSRRIFQIFFAGVFRVNNVCQIENVYVLYEFFLLRLLFISIK